MTVKLRVFLVVRQKDTYMKFSEKLMEKKIKREEHEFRNETGKKPNHRRLHPIIRILYTRIFYNFKSRCALLL